MDLGWKRLIPAALAMLLIVAGFQVDRAWGFVALGGSIVMIALLFRAIDVGRHASAVDDASEDHPLAHEAEQ
jgi:hypothetical protein